MQFRGTARTPLHTRALRPHLRPSLTCSIASLGSIPMQPTNQINKLPLLILSLSDIKNTRLRLD